MAQLLVQGEARYQDAVTLHVYALTLRMQLFDETHPAVARYVIPSR